MTTKKKTKPRLQARALARPVSISIIPADLKRFKAWMSQQGIRNRSEGFRALLDAMEIEREVEAS